MISLLEIKTIIQDYYNLKNIFEKSRKMWYINARQSFCYACREYTNINDEEIARFMRKDRATLIYHYKKWSNFLKFDKTIITQWKEIQQKIEKKIEANREMSKEPTTKLEAILVEERKKNHDFREILNVSNRTIELLEKIVIKHNKY